MEQDNNDFSVQSDDSEAKGRPSKEAVQAQLERLLATRYFRTSPRLRRFLCFTVEQSQNGYEGRLKEYCIALEVFGKPESFDPRIDSAVRVAARQLRAKLDAYYLDEGTHDEVLIRFRPGDYVPRFYCRNDDALRNGKGFREPQRENLRAIVVEKERATVRSIVEALDTLSFPVAGILDSGEEAIETVCRSGGIVITGLALAGGVNGLELTRLVHAKAQSPVIFVAPATLSPELLDEIVYSEPDALIFKPVRASDVAAAIRLAIAKSGGGQSTPASPEAPEMLETQTTG
jgi:CheY-like chemotaxis protein